jgi:hypothetical protein
LRKREPLLLQRRKRVFDAARLRPIPIDQQVLAPASYTMHSFGQIDCLKPSRKSAYQIASDRWIPTSDICSEGNLQSLMLALRDSRNPIMLDHIQQGISALFTQDFAYQTTQCMYVVTQRLMMRRKMNFTTYQNSLPCQ